VSISVIDYGSGNIGSICNILRKAGANVNVIQSSELVSDATCIILPGVGAFDNAMNQLESGGWIDPLFHYAKIDNKPLLGICLGMQLLTRCSDEGVKSGLGFINADTIRFSVEKMDYQRTIPHMGWNSAHVHKKNVLFNRDDPEERFYFVHSYHVVCDNNEDVLATTNYGYEFVSSFQNGNIIGVQFHPEKSHRFGYQFFKSFVEVFCA